MTRIAEGLDNVPEEVLRVTAELGSPPLRIVPLRAADSPRTSPGAFHLTLADQRQLKVRIMIDDGHAVKVERILRAFPGRVFPAVIARRGRLLIIEWIDGQPATRVATGVDVVRACGAIHAFVHTTPVPEDCEYRAVDPVGSARDKLRLDLAAALSAGVLQPSESDRIVELAGRFAPLACEAGFVHRDFCLGNMVIRTSGEVCTIDNETVSVGALDFDLARTWYRWPMTPSERAHYFDAYSRRRDPGAFVAHFPFWALAVLIDSIVLRIRADAVVRDVPLTRLRALLGALAGGATGERLVYEW